MQIKGYAALHRTLDIARTAHLQVSLSHNKPSVVDVIISRRRRVSLAILYFDMSMQ